ncbi:ATP-binding protein [Candidatus Micrarchaeota archaeon]|nr:ATP-binding protein [Candidatus Micrarchaeota archaeon]
MILGITGGKGGTGKTVFAVNLAIAFARMGKKVAYLDCDADCPSAHIIAGTELRDREEVRSFLPHFIKEKCMKCGKCVSACEFNALYQLTGKLPELVDSLCSGCGACMIACPFGAIEESCKVIGWTYTAKKYGVEFFSGELKPSEPLSEKIVDAVKQRGLAKKHEIVIVDTAAGAHCPVVCALGGCDRALAITEPTFFGENDLKIISAVLEKLGIPYETVVNRSTISDRKIESVLEIPYDKTMVECYVDGIPIVEKYPEHQISKRILSFAKRLVE